MKDPDGAAPAVASADQPSVAGASLGFGRSLYPMRVVGAAACIVIAWLYVADVGTVRPWYLFLLVLALGHPHAYWRRAGRTAKRGKVEALAVAVDAFLLGSTVYVTGFSPIPALSLLTVAFANGMALGSLRWMGLSAVSALLGVGLPTLFYGTNFAPRDNFGMNLASALFLLVYFNLFAWVAYRRAVALQGSRLTLRKQKVAAEIQRKKSERLLLSLLPAPVAAEMEQQGAVAPRRDAVAVILLVRLLGLQRLADGMEPDDLLAQLNYCVSAFDQIVQRHRLEPLTPAGDVYVAVGGMRGAREGQAVDAVHAALELREFLAGANESQGALGRPHLDARIVVHSGAVTSGLIGSRKLSFDIWGASVEAARRLSTIGPSGEVVVSAPVLSAVTRLVAARSLGRVAETDGAAEEAFLIEPAPRD